MTPEEHQAANERITKVCNERHLSYVGSMWPTGDLCLDGDFAADDLRVIADAMDGRQAIREAEAAMKEKCAKVAEEREIGWEASSPRFGLGTMDPPQRTEAAIIAAAIRALE